MSRHYKLKLVDGKVSIERPAQPSSTSDETQNLSGSVQRIGSKVQYVPESVDLSFNTFISSFIDKIMDMRLTKKKHK